MHKISNERKCCDAVIRILEEKTGETRSDVWSPEDTPEFPGPKVELRLRLGSQEYALEHTFVEPFEGEYANSIPLEGFSDVVEDALSGVVPQDAVYSVTLPSDRYLKTKRAKLESHRSKLAEWVRENALGLYEKVKSETIKREFSIRGRPDGFPYEVMLTCHLMAPKSIDAYPVSRVGRFLPDDIDTLFVCSMEKATQEKLPKLSECRNEGARTILILEKNDILIHAFTVRNVISNLCDRLSENIRFSDDIYYVDTSNNSGTWYVYCIRENGEFCSDFILRSPTKIVESCLENITTV